MNFLYEMDEKKTEKNVILYEKRRENSRKSTRISEDSIDIAEFEDFAPEMCVFLR
jgi:hypothetical protein